jgi:hypothetical protein
MRQNRRRILAAAAVIIGLFILRAATLDVGEENPVHQPDQHGHYDYKGVIHWHTQYSGDATGTFEDVSRATNEQGVDFMISTDHNTLQPLVDGKEGWRGKTLFLTGVEITRPEGYLLAMDIRHFITDREEATPKVVADILQQGGFVIVAHPDRPRHSWHGPEPDAVGMEILDCADQLVNAPVTSIVAGLLYYPFNRPAAWLELYRHPTKALGQWDDKNKTRPHIGIYASDFHQAIEVTHHIKIPFPKVDSILPIAHDHIVMRNAFTGDFAADKKAVYDAVREGHLYFSLDLVGDASGFFFSAKQPGHEAWMGDILPAGATDFDVTLPANVRLQTPHINIFRDGVKIGESDASDYKFTAKDAGAYRVEVDGEVPSFWGSQRVTWIYSNPVYLGGKPKTIL